MPILNMVSWGCLLNAASNSMISGRGVVEIWKASILGGVVVVGSCGGVSGMVVAGAGCLGGLLVGMEFLWVTRLGVVGWGDGSSRLDVSPFPSKFCAKGDFSILSVL